MSKKAIIFYISKFSGHFHAADAIRKALLTLEQGSDIRMLNAYDTNPIIGRIINRTYMSIITKNPELWGRMYDNPDVLSKIKKTREKLYNFNVPKMKRLFTKFGPDIVYCTQAYPCGMVAAYKRKYGLDIPLVGVLTDHAPHLYWVFDEVDLYVVPTEEVGSMLEKKGIPARKIKVYGIPIDPKYSVKYDKKRLRSEMGLCEKPTVLVMGGSQGLGAIEGIVKSLMQRGNAGYQLLVVTGKNKKLHRNLSNAQKVFPDADIQLYSYVDNIDQMMEASDVIITKAGGITTSESLAKNLPIFIMDPIPGQERFNTDFLVKEGAAIEIKNFDDIPGALDKVFIDDQSALDRMRINAGRLARPDSAFKIAQLSIVGVK
ncbi:MAG TPA: glycosyltransferase [Candidatus Omnitrophota bacterium]|nr:glycosyltransferase [Candidatus Omnitrophota bacterium]HPS20268.1 glycosyltransferase [Candidatus Omnitrophota bacterium]